MEFLQNIRPESIETYATTIIAMIMAIAFAFRRIRYAIVRASKIMAGKTVETAKKVANRGKSTGAVILAALMLGACSPAPAFGTAAAIMGLGVSAYCEGVSEEGKKTVRDTATSGKQLIWCGDDD